MAKKHKHKSKSSEPFEYDPPFESEEQTEQVRVKYKLTMAYLLDQDEVNALIEASNAEYVEPPMPSVSTDYLTYTEEECADLIDGTYHPRRSKKKK